MWNSQIRFITIAVEKDRLPDLELVRIVEDERQFFLLAVREIDFCVAFCLVDAFDSISRGAKQLRPTRRRRFAVAAARDAAVGLNLQARSVRAASCRISFRQRNRSAVLLLLLVVKTQLTGSAPRVSNFAEYSGVLIVIVRFGAAAMFAT